MKSVIWIIGASTGIGRAVALSLANEGAHVVVSARAQNTLEVMREDIEGEGQITPYPLDASDHEAITQAVEDIEINIGPITLMLYAAAYWEPAKASDLSRSAFENAVNVNLLGAVSAIEAILPHMRLRGQGHIALISSVAGYRGLPRAEAYGATKAAMTYLGEAMRLTLTQDGIKVQVISPGFVKTPLTDKNDFPMPFLMDVDDAAKRIVAGLKSKRFEITFPKRFTYFLKLLQCLPYPLYFWLVGRATRSSRS